MASIRKFVLVPIGLPGMGKTTLSRFLHHTCENPINFNKFDVKSLSATNKLVKRTQGGLEQHSLKLDFKKISYDAILGDN